VRGYFKLPLLLLPLLAALTVFVDTPYHRLSTGKLTGVVRVKKMPEPTWETFYSGAFQAKLEAFLEQEVSFKSVMVRTDNTVNLVAFGDISAHTGIPIMLGEQNTLFEMNYVNNTNGVSDVKGDPPPKSPLPIEQEVKRIGRAARAFRALGKDFLFVMYPSKGWIYRDRLPRRYRLPGGASRAQAGYEALVRALRAEGVTVIDGERAYEDLAQSKPDLPLYNRGGTHWTNAGACEVTKLLVDRLSDTGGAKLICGLGPAAPAHRVDADLAGLINVWDNSRFLDMIPSSEPSLSQPLPGGPRNALIVGTSFSSHIIEALTTAGVLDDIERLTYYRHGFARKTKWSRLLRAKHVVIFEQWQWAYVTANISEFMDDLERNDSRYAAALQADTGR
jgi:hypothetical protein